MPEAAGLRRARMTVHPRQRKHPALRYPEEKGANMDITFVCDNCGQPVVVDEAGAGIQVPCPGCGQPLIVPAQEPRHPEPAATARCSVCGETIDAGTSVCPVCGHELADSAPDSPAPPPIPAPPGRGLIEMVKIGLGILALAAIVAVLAVRHTSWWEQHRIVARARGQLVAALGGHPDTVSQCDQIAATWARTGTLTKVDVYQLATTMAVDKDKLFRKRVADSMLYGTPSLQDLLNEQNQALAPVNFCAELQWRCQSASDKQHGLPPPPMPKSLAPPPASGTGYGWLTK